MKRFILAALVGVLEPKGKSRLIKQHGEDAPIHAVMRSSYPNWKRV